MLFWGLNGAYRKCEDEWFANVIMLITPMNIKDREASLKVAEQVSPFITAGTFIFLLAAPLAIMEKPDY